MSSKIEKTFWVGHWYKIIVDKECVTVEKYHAKTKDRIGNAKSAKTNTHPLGWVKCRTTYENDVYSAFCHILAASPGCRKLKELSDVQETYVKVYRKLIKTLDDIVAGGVKVKGLNRDLKN